MTGWIALELARKNEGTKVHRIGWGNRCFLTFSDGICLNEDEASPEIEMSILAKHDWVVLESVPASPGSVLKKHRDRLADVLEEATEECKVSELLDILGTMFASLSYAKLGFEDTEQAKKLSGLLAEDVYEKLRLLIDPTGEDTIIPSKDMLN